MEATAAGRSSLVAGGYRTIRALGGSCSRRGRASKGEPWLRRPPVWLWFRHRRGRRDSVSRSRPVYSVILEEWTARIYFVYNIR
jgi:hypothetical protein